MKKKFKKKEKHLTKQTVLWYILQRLLRNSMAGKMVFENKGKGKKKKNKPKSNIFGKENKRRINQKKEIFAKAFYYTFVYHISFYKSTFLKK